jgi:hypothetical protein
MANPRMVRRPAPHRPGNSDFGINPTIQQKIIQMAKSKYGLDPSTMQGAAFTIFDTVALATSTNRQTYEFFSAAQGKSLNFSNLVNGTLQAGEFIGVEYLYVAIITTSNSAALNLDTTSISAVQPLMVNPALLTATANLTIANQTWIKNQPLIESHPSFNMDSTGMASIDTTAGVTQTLWGVSRIRLKANPVIPPNMAFKLSIGVGPLTAVANTCLWVGLGNTGSIFAPK